MAEGALEQLADRDVAAGLRGAMRRLASGVAIVVAKGEGGPSGMAATSITSLTLDPPAVLVCVNRTASLHACIAPGCIISINLLGKEQQHISSAFGGSVPREKRFSVGAWSEGGNGLLVLDGAQANLGCTVDQMIPYGTHSIVIARVNSVRLSEAVSPLIFQDGGYL